MIVLDTNVVSELMKPAPAKKVVDWIAAKTAASLYIASITRAEILHSILLLPVGKRRKAIDLTAQAMASAVARVIAIAAAVGSARPAPESVPRGRLRNIWYLDP